MSASLRSGTIGSGKSGGGSVSAKGSRESLVAPYASPPFSKETSILPDIVLRSSDGVRFYALKTILAIASPIFRDMLIIGQGSDGLECVDNDDGYPLVDVSEDSRTLDSFLRFCYPTPIPSIRGLEDGISILEASRKYETPAVEHGCKKFLHNHAMKDSMVAYIIACKFGLEEVAAFAAEKTMYLSLEELLQCSRPETEEVGFACVQRLCTFRKDCQQRCLDYLNHINTEITTSNKGPYTAPWKRITNFSEVGALISCCPEVVVTHNVTSASSGEKRTLLVSVKTWYNEYEIGMKERLSNAYIIGRSAAAEEALLDDAMTGAILCGKCRPWAFKELKVHGQKIKDSLNNITAKVASKHTFSTKSKGLVL